MRDDLEDGGDQAGWVDLGTLKRDDATEILLPEEFILEVHQEPAKLSPRNG